MASSATKTLELLPGSFLVQLRKCRTRICLFLAFTTLVTLCSPAPSSCMTPRLVIEPEKQFEYAEAPFRNGDYPETAGEYKRFVHFFPDHPLAQRALFQIGMSYFNNREHPKALKAFTDLIDPPRDTDLSHKAYVFISRCHLMLNAPGPAILALEKLISLTPDAAPRDEAHYRIGWIYLETGDWEKAEATFKKISSGSRLTFDLKAIFDDLDRRNDLILKKSPALAGFLSIVPGAGHLYCGRYRDALTAFVATGVLAYAAYESFDNDLDALGGILSLVGLGFYAGNILGATASAHKYNRDQTRRFVDHLKRKVRVDLFSGAGGGRMGVSLTYRF